MQGWEGVVPRHCAKRAAVAESAAAGGYEGSPGAVLLNIHVSRQEREPHVKAVNIRSYDPISLCHIRVVQRGLNGFVSLS